MEILLHIYLTRNERRKTKREENVRDSISRFLRSGMGTLLWSIGVLIAIGAHLWLLFANYSGLVQAFELLGTDQKPLGDDPLFGWTFEALLLGDANQGHLFAGILVVALAAGFWLLCYYIFRLISLAGSRVRFQNQEDMDSVREAEIRIKYDNLPYLLITLIPLIAAAWWDIRLFNFRSLAGGYGIETPEDAHILKNMSATMAEIPDNFSHALTNIGGWGYLATTFLTAFFLKFAWNQLKESAITLEGSLLDLMNIGVENQPYGELGAAENPAEELVMAETPAEQRGRAIDAPVSKTSVSSNMEELDATGGMQHLKNMHPIDNSNAAALSDGTVGNANAEQDVNQGPSQSQSSVLNNAEVDELVIVVGENEPVRMSEIMVNQERYYRHEDGRWWNREYYESLHANGTSEKEVA